MEKNNVRAFKSRFKYSIRAYFRDCLFHFVCDVCAHCRTPRISLPLAQWHCSERQNCNRRAAFLFPLSALFVATLFLGFHRLIPIIYLSFCLSVLICGLFRNRQKLLSLSAATLLGATQFFLVTNFSLRLSATPM
jgi:Family of unknown function (DUF6580)